MKGGANLSRDGNFFSLLFQQNIIRIPKVL